MSAGKHTPGPWFAPEYQIVGLVPQRIIETDDDFMIASVLGHEGGELDANAYLIAAAPDMLEALKGLLCFYEPGTAQAREAIRAARDAVAMAEGRER